MQTRALKAILEGHLSALAQIQPEWFTDKGYNEVFQACTEVVKDTNLSYESLRDYINEHGYREPFKSSMLQVVRDVEDPGIMFTGDFVDSLKREYLDKKLNGLASALVTPDSTLNSRLEAIRKFEDEIYSNNESHADISDTMDSWITSTENGVVDEFNSRCLKINNPVLQGIIGKFRPVPYCIAGRPGFHKTDLAVNILVDFSKSKYKGAYFALEDSTEMLTYKYMHVAAELPRQKVYDQDKNVLPQVKHIRIPKNQIFIYDKKYNLLKFRRDVDYACKILKAQFIIVDYIQLFYLPKNIPEHQALGHITKEFMDICKKHKVPLIFTSQVNERDESKSGSVKLDLGDLKGSGSLEQDVRVALLIDGNRQTSEKRIYKAKDTYDSSKFYEVAFDRPSGVLKYWGNNERKH